ncbi:hypothetical protein [Deinococcus enclensis]|uniref:Uncharacterized protein n=1 Tax=Deinococcus enclensis TaxID=1049582 RepID=A0ABT9MIQ3_9DEIO|nr:hypothetical protein [Deinococcus enclensis]MDP9766478.1 hypothetical protein [Deinococcus enclensis]
MTNGLDDWTLDELLEESRAMLRGQNMQAGLTVTVEADADACAVLFVGRRAQPPGAAIVKLDLDAVIEDGMELPHALWSLLAELRSPDLPACGPDDVPPVVRHVRRTKARILN